MVTDVSIDPAGDVWVANNWNKLEAAAGGPGEAAAHWQSTKVLNEWS